MCCSIGDIISCKNIKSDTISAILEKTDEDFALQLYKDNNIIASKTKIYFFLYNLTCFKYRVAMSGNCHLDFSYLYIKETRVTELGFIHVS